MTAKQLAAWILTQPQDIQDGDVCSVVHGKPFTAKRAMAIRTTDGRSMTVVNSMGTHLDDNDSFEFVSTINHGGRVISPETVEEVVP